MIFNRFERIKVVSVAQQYTYKTNMSVTLSTTSKNAPLLIHNGFSYIIDRRSDKKILWKCEHARKFKCYGRLHTDLNNIFIQTVGDHENHTGDPRSGQIRRTFIIYVTYLFCFLFSAVVHLLLFIYCCCY